MILPPCPYLRIHRHLPPSIWKLSRSTSNSTVNKQETVESKIRVTVLNFGRNFATVLRKIVSSNEKGKWEGLKLFDSKKSVHTVWIVNSWTARLNTKMQRSSELSEVCLDAGYIPALDTENVGGQRVFKAVLWHFLFSKQISAIYSAIP